jgi:hypothetical protein
MPYTSIPGYGCRIPDTDTKELKSRELESRELRAFGSQEADQWTKREGTK